jgi:hypothetical protein
MPQVKIEFSEWFNKTPPWKKMQKSNSETNALLKATCIVTDAYPLEKKTKFHIIYSIYSL